MVFLKEDGSLDIERINNLPIDEFADMMGDLTQVQMNEYVSKLTINESYGPTRPIVVDYTLEEELERGGVIVDDLLNNLRKKHGMI